MRLFVFADPQGNPWAVEALLDRAKKRKATDVVCLGSAVGSGPDPARTVELLRKRYVVLVRGLHDEAALGMPTAAAAGEAADVRALGDANARRLTGPDLSYLRGASPPRRLTTGGRTLLLTSEPDAPRTLDILVQPGPTSGLVDGGRIARLGSAAPPTGEAPYLLVDDEEGGELRFDVAAWDVDAYERGARATRREADAPHAPR